MQPVSCLWLAQFFGLANCQLPIANCQLLFSLIAIFSKIVIPGSDGSETRTLPGRALPKTKSKELAFPAARS
jgi:hypothetical protein